MEKLTALATQKNVSTMVAAKFVATGAARGINDKQKASLAQFLSLIDTLRVKCAAMNVRNALQAIIDAVGCVVVCVPG